MKFRAIKSIVILILGCSSKPISENVLSEKDLVTEAITHLTRATTFLVLPFVDKPRNMVICTAN